MTSKCKLPQKATFISSKYPDTNYYCCERLRIYSENKYYNSYEESTLLSFVLDMLDDHEAVQYQLFIPLSNAECCNKYNKSKINIFKIYEHTDFENVTFNNLKYKKYYCSFDISRSDIDRGYLIIDISSLIEEYKNNDKRRVNLMLSPDDECIFVAFNKCNNKCIPKLNIKLKEECTHNQPECNKSVAMQLHCIPNLRNIEVKDNDTIKFNKIIENTMTGICYDKENYIINIKSKGYYLFQWTINIEGAKLIKYLSISLKNLNNNTEVQSVAPISLQGQLIGSALVRVKSCNEDFKLINTSGGDIMLFSESICASIIVNKI